jgi:hypothetical protein
MALSYVIEFQIPDSYTLPGTTGHIVAYQLSSGGPGADALGTTVLDQINWIWNTSLLGQWGGSITITTSPSVFPNTTIYNIVWTGLTTDPEQDNLTGDITTILLNLAGGTFGEVFFGGAFYSQERCIDEGLCPDCPEPTPIDTTPCDICYDVTTDPCGETIFLPGLDADTTYTLTMTDNNAGVSYNYEVTTDETGEASVIIADFPVGAFSTFSNYTVTIVDEDGNPAQVTIGYTTYDCYNLIFTPSTTVTS